MKLNMKIIILLFLMFSCTRQENQNRFIGFWEGPHPEDITKKFYIQITDHENEIAAKGFWTKNSFYDSEFRVNRVMIAADSISFYVPNWNCFYVGRLSNDQYLHGGFQCEGEPFDSVSLRKTDEIAEFLTQAKPNSCSENYRYVYTRPVSLNDHLQAAPYQSANDSLFIYSIIPEMIRGDYGRINSFLLLKEGRLICEEYFYGYTHNDMHQIESCTKSITSLLVGMAMDQGLITDIQEPLYKIFPAYKHLRSGEYQHIGIYHLLTMTSGFSTENDATYEGKNRIDHAIKRELAIQPGRQFVYDGGNTEILGAIIKTKTGMFADEFAEKYLFTPLKIETYNWEILKQDSFPCMGGSLKLRPRDMVKIGLMVLNEGKFENQQIVSPQWIRESTSMKTSTHIEGDNYGYHWWNIRLLSSGSAYQTIWANGLGSQFIYIIPEIEVVIVTTGFNYEHDSWAITNGISQYLHFLHA
jgi:hypothetical protein